MITAVCISGQPRSVKRGFAYIEPHLLAHNECDIFIHTWFDEKQIGHPYINAGGHVASDPVEANVLAEIRRLYKPIRMESEPQIDFDERNYAERAYPAINPFASLSQKYSSMRAHELRREHAERTGKKYDAVVRLRFDYALRTHIFIDKFDLSAVNVSNRCPHRGGIDDTFAIGNEANMNVYGELFNHIQETYDAGVPFCDEILLGQYLAKNGIPIKLHHIEYDLIRD
jgi:hypothetical protein